MPDRPNHFFVTNYLRLLQTTGSFICKIPFTTSGGEIIFKETGCAYLNPHNVELTEDPGCILSYTDGNPIDSSLVYLYQAGVFNVNTSNCKRVQKHDPYTGEYYNVDECDVSGNFNLTLVNNQGDIIEIKNGVLNGKFQFQ